MSVNLLDVKDVRVFYDKVEALKGVSLDIEKGEVTAALGANGSGKTTLLRTVCGLKAPTSGEIWFNGQSIKGRKPEQIVRAGISMVPEGRKLFRYMTVKENLMVGAYIHSSNDDLIKNSLDSVYYHFPVLEGRTRQLAADLSGGEQQMVAMGRALMSNPKMLLLDEPSMGLSPVMKREIAQIIEDIHQGGISIILVEQNTVMALKMAGKVYVMQTGRIIAKGSPEELRRNDRIREIYLGG
jgi:branched-chain amino acid transport system ATP-binding protein